MTAPGVGFLDGGRTRADGFDGTGAPEIGVGGVEGDGLICGQDQFLPGGLPHIMASGAVLGKDRLDFLQIVEVTRFTIPAFQGIGCAFDGFGLSSRGWNSSHAVFMAAHTALGLAGLDDGPAAHGLDHHAVLVQQLEVHKTVGRYLEIGRAVVFHGNSPQDPLVFKRMPVHGRSFLALTEPAVVPGAE